MAGKDITEKTLEAYNDVFADIVNVLLFHGEQIIKPNSLVDATSTSQYKADGKVHEQERDVAKYWKHGNIRIALYGLENQTAIDKDMPLRVIGYDGAVYRGQLNDIKNLKRGQKRYPVVTLVLYFGMRHWKHNRTLLECMRVPEPLKPYVNDYRINVFEIAYLTPEQVELFRSDFRIVAEYFVQKRMHSDYRPSPEILQHVDAILKLMSVLTNDVRYEDEINDFRGRSDLTMCDVLDKIVAKGKAEGRAEGKAEGAENKTIEFAEKMIKHGEPVAKIQEYTDLTLKKLQMLSKKLDIALVM